MSGTSDPAPAGERKALVVVGASAGGVEALKRVVERLPADLPAAVCVVLHIAPTSPSALAAILRRAGHLPCHTAVDGALLEPGQIMVAPPDRHLVIEDGHVRLTVGPRENGHRPAIDTLFRTAAEAWDGQVLGVILSGTRDDGTAGLALIKAGGGAAVVQDPEQAMYRGMPASALEHVAVDAVAGTDQLGEAIAALVRGEDVPEDARPPALADDPAVGETLTSVCPECGGVLTEHVEAGMPQWRCHVGHRYSPDSLVDAQSARVEAALWTAVRALRDRGALLERMADHSDSRGDGRTASRYRRQANDARSHADVVRRALADAASNSLQTQTGDDAGSAEAAGRT